MKKTLPSGATLDITLLDWEAAWEVTQDVLRVIEKLDIDLKGMNFTEIQAQDVMAFKSPLCRVLASKEIMEASKKCFARCTYDNTRIGDGTFNKPEARADFLVACFHVLKENCAPFFVGLLSGLKVP